MNGIVIDTNVFVAAGFNSKSAAARILGAVREGRLQLVWNTPTRRETETILRRIPGLDWARVADLFRPEGEFTGPVDLDAFVMIADRDDRKFVALSAAATTPLVTNDNHVLAQQRAVALRSSRRAPSPSWQERDWTFYECAGAGALHPDNEVTVWVQGRGSNRRITLAS